MRLIDADAFNNVLMDAQSECKKNGGNFRYGVLSNVRANLAGMPTFSESVEPGVDFVRVVRCRECKYWDRRECGSYGTCESENMSICGFTDADWFCADGRMKE